MDRNSRRYLRFSLQQVQVKGSAMRQKAKVERYDSPAGGWGSLNAVVHILTQEGVAVLGSEILLKQNKPGGFMCLLVLIGAAFPPL
jgi:hypothetical protein